MGQPLADEIAALEAQHVVKVAQIFGRMKFKTEVAEAGLNEAAALKEFDALDRDLGNEAVMTENAEIVALMRIALYEAALDPETEIEVDKALQAAKTQFTGGVGIVVAWMAGATILYALMGVRAKAKSTNGKTEWEVEYKPAIPKEAAELMTSIFEPLGKALAGLGSIFDKKSGTPKP
ncbi:MAG: hypothetical protein MRY64_06525 [Hyphomonadaceae bacterium]|nr:hypothetical protein [Hyphomonadaceae bacterium]